MGTVGNTDDKNFYATETTNALLPRGDEQP